MSGQGGSFLADAFHQITIAADRVRVVVDDLVSRPVVARRQPRRSNREAHAVGETLPERSRGGLDTGRQTALRVAWRFAPPFSKMFDLFQGQVVTTKEQQAV